MTVTTAAPQVPLMRDSGAIALGRQEKWPPKNRPFMEAFNIQLGSPRQSRTLQLLLQPHFDQRLIGHIPGVRSGLDRIKKMLR